jgi:hypothetical protein
VAVVAAIYSGCAERPARVGALDLSEYALGRSHFTGRRDDAPVLFTIDRGESECHRQSPAPEKLIKDPEPFKRYLQYRPDASIEAGDLNEADDEHSATAKTLQEGRIAEQRAHSQGRRLEELRPSSRRRCRSTAQAIGLDAGRRSMEVGFEFLNDSRKGRHGRLHFPGHL